MWMNLEFEIQVVLGAGKKLFGGFFRFKEQKENLPMKFGRIGGYPSPLPSFAENILGDQLLADFGVPRPSPFLERIRQTVFDRLPLGNTSLRKECFLLGIARITAERKHFL